MRQFDLRKIGHVVLNVTDLEASVRFYTEVLGLQVSDRYQDSLPASIHRRPRSVYTWQSR